MAALVGVIAVASLHHIFSLVGPGRDFRYGFGLLHVGLAAVVAGWIWMLASGAVDRASANGDMAAS